MIALVTIGEAGQGSMVEDKVEAQARNLKKR
jgi:hypothetical protein